MSLGQRDVEKGSEYRQRDDAAGRDRKLADAISDASGRGSSRADSRVTLRLPEAAVRTSSNPRVSSTGESAGEIEPRHPRYGGPMAFLPGGHRHVHRQRRTEWHEKCDRNLT